MTFGRRTGLLTAALVLVASGGAYYEHVTCAARDEPAPTADARLRPDFMIPDLEGRPTGPGQWDGKVVLYNFWAAWCPPCRREIPVFNEVREFYREDGFEVVGVAIDDREAVVKFLDGLGDVAYPQLIGVAEGTQAMSDFGNAGGGLPYSALVDAQKRVRYVKRGELKKGDLIRELEKLLAEAP